MFSTTAIGSPFAAFGVDSASGVQFSEHIAIFPLMIFF